MAGRAEALTLLTKAIDAITQDNDSDGALGYMRQAHRALGAPASQETALQERIEAVLS